MWAITTIEFWWDYISSLALLSSICFSLILVLESVSVFFCKVMSSFDQRLVWMLIRGRFEFTITLSMFYLFLLFVLILLMCEVTVKHLLLLEMYESFLPCFFLDDVNAMTIYFTFKIKYLSITIMKLEYWEDVQCH